MMELDALWSEVLDDLEGVPPAPRHARLRLTRLRALVEDTALLDVPDASTRHEIEGALKPALATALGRHLGRTVFVAVSGGTRVPLGVTDLDVLWTKVLNDLESVSPAPRHARLRLTRLRALVEDTVLLDVPDVSTRDEIEGTLKPALATILARHLGRAVLVVVRLHVAPQLYTR